MDVVDRTSPHAISSFAAVGTPSGNLGNGAALSLATNVAESAPTFTEWGLAAMLVLIAGAFNQQREAAA